MRTLIAIVIALASTLAAGGETPVGCVSFGQERADADRWVYAEAITRPGRYCLSEDITAPKPLVPRDSHEGPGNDGLLKIFGNDVTVDLQGHTLYAEISGTGLLQSRFAGREDALNNRPSRRHITVRNGTLRSRTSFGIRFGEMFNHGVFASLASDYTAYSSRQVMGPAERAKLAAGEVDQYVESSMKKLKEDLPRSVDDFPMTRHRIEDLRIESNTMGSLGGQNAFLTALGIQGGGNVIRNNTIEVTSGHAAIYLFGPDQIIENNIIVFKGRPATPSAAPIKLHMADGSIIRNNDIVVEGWEGLPEAAISLVDSKNVRIENNRIYGIKTAYKTWDEQSAAVTSDNDFRILVRRPSVAGAPGVRNQASAAVRTEPTVQSFEQADEARLSRYLKQQDDLSAAQKEKLRLAQEHYENSLTAAVKRMDKTRFETMLKAGTALDTAEPPGDYGKAPLAAALEKPELAGFALALIRAGANVHPIGMPKGVTALMLAAGNSTPEVVEALVERQTLQINEANPLGTTALGYAVAASRIDNVRLLLKFGADPKRLSGKDKLTDIARWNGREDIAKLLDETSR